MKRLLTHARILTMKKGDSPVRDGYLLMNGDTIAQVGEGNPPSDWDEVTDMKGRLILPGFINTHGHAAMTLLRGYADDLPLQTWLEDKMWPIEGKFGPRQVKWGTSLAVIEMIRGGTTCFADMYDHMEEVARVVEETGIRASLCRGVIGLGNEAEREAKRRESVRFVRDWDGQADGRISAMMAPHAPYTCPPAYIEAIVADAAEANVPIHIHLSETRAEVEQNVKDYGLRPVEHLRRLGVFDRPALVAHAVHVTKEEIGILAEHGVKVSHNPGSNLKLGSGIAPVPTMLKRGLRPSLGTDSAASNNNLDMLEEIRLAALIHKGAHMDPEAVPAETALEMGTLYGAESLFWDHEIGTLEPGKKADLISLDLDGAHMQPPHDLLSHVVYAAGSADVQDVFVNGRPLMRNRELLTIDEERVKFEAKEAYREVAP
ncbi:5-methylthioadenosine/S-adenosylhomocysteine deaminase [Melghirimyces profundicolus]|uniref:5-methylthioadenosine/S-adenosylhomocysteine deaminase n=1 Tax=Melghirimyces profundicolus TaxID=1242148 RepID=A0A2T6BV82_9BACL|nr:amidohydrolase [Melghirimyces profundicolus]PTX59946.1 5-methylthioadenosine/S-adenosylhomocysteine deaminase [Melghirimyces profundicolus]